MTLITSLVSSVLIATLLSFTSIAHADFGFAIPFGWHENDERDYQYGSPSPIDKRYDRIRWRRYDDWEPNFWRYRFVDNDYNDSIYGRRAFHGIAKSRGRFSFDMNVGFDVDLQSNLKNRHFRPGRHGRYNRSRKNAPYGHDILGNRIDIGINPFRRDPLLIDDQPFFSMHNFGEDYTQDYDRYDDDYWRGYTKHHDRLGGSPF